MKYLAKMMLCVVLICTLCMPVTADADELTPLAPGSRGQAVSDMQKRLNELGFYFNSVDGDYGNISKKAVMAFQAANGLPQDGIASLEVLELMFSDRAVAAPPRPDVEVTSVQRSNYRLKIVLKNNTTEPIEYVELKLMTYNRNGSIYSDYAASIDNYGSEWFNYSIPVSKTIAPGKSVTFSDYYDISAPVLAVGAKTYHTASGRECHLSSEQITFFTSDGNTIEALDQSKNYQTISKADYDRARTLVWGYSYYEIPHYLANFYMYPVGSYLTEVTPGSIAEKAGLQPKDVIIAIDGQKVSNVYSAEYAKLKMLDGEPVEIEYWRNNQLHTTIFSLDEAYYATSEPAEEEAPSLSIADELLKYADLLENGLITQEEYEILKQKLLN